MRNQERIGKYQIESDGITVWVNSTMGLIGRFGRAGIDIHRCSKEQSEKGECLHCTHKPVTATDWNVFVAKMHEHYHVKIPARFKPDRFKQSRKRVAHVTSKG